MDTQWMLTDRSNLKTCVLASKTETDLAAKTLLGTRTTKGWVTRRLGFALVTDHAWTVERLPKADPQEKGERLVLTFADVKPGDAVLVKIGLSASGDSAKALANLKAEIPAWDFDAKRAAANAAWEKQLSVLSAEGTEDQLVSFYTSIYHLFFQPNNVADVGERPFYSTFSCWDTFRAAGPLYTILYPEKAAERIREVFDRFYLPKPDGRCGNDDCGQMSAWYLFSAMGFYPFNPCGGEYVLGAPQLPKVTLHCSTSTSPSTSFTILAKNLSKECKYVKSVTLNGRPVTNWKIRHADIMAGGELVFTMGK